MNAAAARRARTARRLREALEAVGLPEIRVSVFAAGVAVDDGAYLWSARPGALRMALDGLAGELEAIRVRAKGDVVDASGIAYDRLCALTPHLRRGDEQAKRLHRQVVHAYQRETGRAGNWL